MAVPKERRSSRRQGRKRAQHKVKLPQVQKCPYCGTLKRPHFACPVCGKTEPKIEKKNQQKKKINKDNEKKKIRKKK